MLDKECLEVARRQFCLDVGLSWEEYCVQQKKKIYICKSSLKMQKGARIYAGRSDFFRAIICLGQLFICCDEKMYDWVMEQYTKCKPEWFCDYKNLRKLDEKLREFGYEIFDTHVYFLPETCEEMAEVSLQEKCVSTSEFVWYEQEELLQFQANNRFTSAICFWEGTPDVLAVAAMRDKEETERTKSFDQNHMCGMAGVSRDGEYLWQIGINVDEDSAGQGLGHKLVRALKDEILHRGKVPFYGTSESHIVSQTVGLKAGFVPAWTEVSVREISGKPS